MVLAQFAGRREGRPLGAPVEISPEPRCDVIAVSQQLTFSVVCKMPFPKGVALGYVADLFASLAAAISLQACLLVSR